ncbi:MAG TPA: DUF6350 family protein [Nocardioidaceae bacterium]|nr:DUF6350 family protein [Nocardioidaceae bacterium]
MTDLLSPPRRSSTSSAGRPAGRSPLLSAVLGGLAASGSMLLVSVAVALAGWFAADAGRYGDTRDATRVGADAWLLAHGAGLRLDTATVTVVPLGLTLLCALATFRVGRWVAATAALGGDRADLRPVLNAAGVMATVYALVALVTAILASHPRAESDLLRALVGAFVLGVVAGGSGLLARSGLGRVLVARLPGWARAVLLGGASALLATVAASAFLVGTALLLDFGTAATVLSRLHTDGSGGLMYTVVGLLVVPNAVLLGAAYLLGPGFAVGAGTVVSPTAVVLGPLPSFPLLAALPGAGATPAWTTAVIGAPVLLTALAVTLASRRAHAARVDLGALCGLGAGLLAAVLLTALVVLAGGAVGPGRMAAVGGDAWATLTAAAVSCGGGGLLGGALGTWWALRRARSEESSRVAGPLSTPGTGAR